MTEDEVNKLHERVAWLERKMVRVLWMPISVTSLFAGLVAAYIVDKSFGWTSIIVAVGAWLTLGFVFQRQEFRGAPKHIEFIDP
jgi:hypothetical protein